MQSPKDRPRRWRRHVGRLVVVVALATVSAVATPARPSDAAGSGPTAPGWLTAQSSGGSVVLGWGASVDDVGVTGYLVHRDWQFLAWVPSGTSFVDSAVVVGQTYRYEVRGQDGDRNNSVPSAPVVVTHNTAGSDPPLGGLNGLIVTSWGSDWTADGSAQKPYGSIAAAAQAASPGSTVYVSNGTYRESVSVIGKSLRVRAVPGAEPVLSGADRVSNWNPSNGRWWAPSSGFADGGWPSGATMSPRSGLVDIVVFDGVQLRQVTSSGEVAPNTFWVDGSENVWIGRDPTGHTVEITTRVRGLFASNVNGFLVEGLTFRHFAAGPGEAGALEISGTNTVIRDVRAHDNGGAGIRLVGANPLVENSRADFNGRIGLTMDYVDGAVIRQNVFSGNNTESFSPFGAAGGVKTTASRNVSILDNVVNDNEGHGIWFDLSSIGITIDGNTASRNSEAGILVEVSAQATVSDNVTDENLRGIYIVESNDVAVTGNNASYNSSNILVLDGYRDGSVCVDREAGAIHVPPIDRRYGCQWPTVKWDIDNLLIESNTLVGGRSLDRGTAMLGIDHVAHPAGDIELQDRRRTAEEMNVTIGVNTFQRTQSGVPRWLVSWPQWPSHMEAYEQLSDFINATGQAIGSTSLGP